MTTLTTFAPVNSLRMWTDGRDIFVEIPGKPPIPAVISRFPLSDNGLWRALNLLRKQTYEYAGEPMLKPKPIDPGIALAQSILKKNGVI